MDDWYTIKHFTHDEFTCPCCGGNKISINLVKKLDEARELAGIPFVINSGYRCKKHNKVVGGTITSSHLKGLAVDLKVTNSRSRYIILTALIKVGFNRIGIGASFIHCDIDKDKSQNVIWTYYAEV